MIRLTPVRRHGVEILDDPATPDDVRAAAMADVERSNALFGGARAVLKVVDGLLAGLPPGAVLLDVGTGRGDIPALVARHADARGRPVTTIGLDLSPALARTARTRVAAAMVGDALQLPVRPGSIDVVISSQVLHHFFGADMRRFIAELDRASRGWVVVADLRRSIVAAVAFWLGSFLFRFHWATRLDGITSVLRGFTVGELEALVRDVTGATPTVRRGRFWRLTATWRVRGR